MNFDHSPCFWLWVRCRDTGWGEKRGLVDWKLEAGAYRKRNL